RDRALAQHAIGAPARRSGPRGLQRVTLEPRRIILQRADTAGLGLLAPGLQPLQTLGGVVAPGLEHFPQARAVFDQGVDPRALLHPLLQLGARFRTQPAAIVSQALAQLAR